MNYLKREVKRMRPLMGTYVEIRLSACVAESRLHGWLTEAFEAMEEVERCMSVFQPSSDISRLNRARPDTWIRMQPMTRAVLRATNQLWRLSSGAFDIRCMSALASRHAPVRFSGSSVSKSGPWTVDLGGIAKGFAVDMAVQRIHMLARHIQSTGIVNAGGDLRVWGQDDASVASSVPGPQNPILRRFLCGPMAMASSTIRDPGSVLHHRMAPAHYRQMPSGRPVQKVNSAIVFAGDCMWADALTKVVLTGPRAIASRCLAAYRAKAVLFGAQGEYQKVFA